MSGPGAGFEYPPVEVSWLKRDALLFANSIGCTPDELHFLYVIDFYAAQKAIKIPGVPEFDPRRAVDGQRLIQFLKPLPVTSEGRKFELRTKVLGVYDKGRPGTVVETQSELVDAATGEAYTRALGSGFYVGQGNWGGPKGPATENFPPPKGKTPDAEFSTQTTTQTPILYRLNGDYNPLHIHPEPGKKMGFGGVIIHGLYSWNWAAHGLLQHLGASDPANMKEFQARFASPVRPGDKLVASAWRTGERKGEWEEIRFVVKIDGGKIVLSNGRALMKVVGAAKSKFISAMSRSPQIGDRLSYDGAVCTVRYIGEVAGTSGSWLGVEWDDAARGKHDGSHKGARYFTCRSRSATPASFVRPTRPADVPVSFIAALQDKYAAELSETVAISFSGKVAEEVGFEKTRSKQAQLSELRYAVLDGTRIDRVYGYGDKKIEDTCAKVVELDLSRNLFMSVGPAVDICRELPRLRELRLNGNRFRDILEDEGLRHNDAKKSLQGVKELALEETLMSWEEIGHVAAHFETLSTLSASTNQLSSLPSIPLSSLTSTLTSLNLEFNNFTSIAQLNSLTALTALQQLHLKGNNIATIQASNSSPTSPSSTPVFSPNLQYLDISYNQILSWSFVDDLPICFPGLTSLRLAHNPIYDHSAGDPKTNPKTLTEEAYMFTIGRLTGLRTLNFGAVTAADRQDAEMYYLALIGKHLAAVPDTPEAAAEVLKQHRRYDELCKLYGAPAVNRKKEINPAFLEARLVNVEFIFHPHLPGDHNKGDGSVVERRTTRIPKSFDIYAVKGIAGKLFGLTPLSLRLIWETGEWDPVAGFDDEVGDSSGDEEDPEGEQEEDRNQQQQPGEKAGKFVKREVELHDGPRQLGFCVDGLEAKIRIELR
ncbi:Thioesterase/thiol ester dehydrase-isomerase [Nemania sp. FL0916]|nr:Thioesterase/thiol ester dehydrase-isomerase [Nemania sp. FL0916]